MKAFIHRSRFGEYWITIKAMPRGHRFSEIVIKRGSPKYNLSFYEDSFEDWYQTIKQDSYRKILWEGDSKEVNDFLIMKLLLKDKL